MGRTDSLWEVSGDNNNQTQLKKKRYRVSLAEKVVIPAGSRMVVPGKVPAAVLPKGSTMMESMSKPPGGKCMMVGRSLMEGCSGRVKLEVD